ncbi:MAG: amino acid ABC transporter permease [Oscillospiraceae bacterium]|nr:amino acid ABC transporter permease [Oscillospiraceae bacterium]
MTLQTIISEMVKCFGTTLSLFLLTLLGSLPLGLLVAFGRMSKHWLPRNFTRVYISIMRGTPLMLQMWVVFFGIPKLIPIGSNWRYIAAVIAFIINYAAYFAEIYRSGIESIPAGQYEAAEVLGYGKAQTFFKIILPQVVKIILPSVTNEVITLVKDTSLCYAIGLVEMFTRAKQIATSTSTLTSFVVAGVMYYIFNFVVAWIMERCEKRLSYFH